MDGVELASCWTCPPVKESIPSMCLVDGGNALGYQKMDNSLQNIQHLASSCGLRFYVAGPVAFLVIGDLEDVGGRGLSEYNAHEC